MLTAEVERCLLTQAEIAHFTLAAGRRIGRRAVEQRITQYRVIAFVLMHHASKNRALLLLTAQANGALQAGIAGHNLTGGVNGVRADVGAGKAPAILRVTDQRIDAVGTAANIHHVEIARQHATVIAGQQIRQRMNVVSAARHRGRQIAFRQLPVQVIKQFQQRLIQQQHRVRIGEIDRQLTVTVGAHFIRQRRMRGSQGSKIITALMAVTRMKERGSGRLVHRFSGH